MTEAADTHLAQLRRFDDRENRCRRALDQLVKQADAAGLPPLSWQVSYAGVATGRVSTAVPNEERQKQYERWLDFLGPYVKREHDHSDLYNVTVIKRCARAYGKPGFHEAIVVEVAFDRTWYFLAVDDQPHP